MSKLRSLLAVVFIVLTSSTFAGIPEQLGKYLEDRAALGHFNGTALIARDGEILLHSGFGFADFPSRVPADRATRYRVASITKQFTAAAIVILRDQGKLDLDDPISKHLAIAPPAWNGVTIRHLLSHTSGIPDYESALGLGSPAYSEFMSGPDVPARIVDEATKKPLDFLPGSEFRYSNTGYVLLGMIAERASGQSLDSFLRESIFGKLHMDSTGMDREGLVVPGRAEGGSFEAEPDRRAFYSGLDLGALVKPAPAMRMCPPQGDCGLLTTTGDLFLWARSLSTDVILPEKSRGDMLSPGLGDYGFGWFIRREGNRTLQEHDGELPGFHSIVRRYPEEGVTIILLSNTELFLGRMTDEIASICFGEEINWPKKQVFADQPAEALEPLIGEYQDTSGRILAVSMTKDGLAIGHKGRFTALLMPKSRLDFFVPMFGGDVRFELDAAGDPISVTLMVRGAPWRCVRRGK